MLAKNANLSDLPHAEHSQNKNKSPKRIALLPFNNILPIVLSSGLRFPG